MNQQLYTLVRSILDDNVEPFKWSDDKLEFAYKDVLSVVVERSHAVADDDHRLASGIVARCYMMASRHYSAGHEDFILEQGNYWQARFDEHFPCKYLDDLLTDEGDGTTSADEYEAISRGSVSLKQNEQYAVTYTGVDLGAADYTAKTFTKDGKILGAVISGARGDKPIKFTYPAEECETARVLAEANRKARDMSRL